MKNSRIVYSLGTSKRSSEEFLKVLKDYQIKLVIDVRRFPTSRFDHFQQTNLVACLRQAGIDYFYLGDKLGGYRTGGYQAFLKTADFTEGIQELETILKKPQGLSSVLKDFPGAATVASSPLN